jgi:hypothetical protein
MIDSGWRVFEACGGGKIHELFDIPITTYEKRNLFCFSTKETRCHLEPIGDDIYRFVLEKKEQTDFSYVELLFNQRDDNYFYFSGNSSIKRPLINSILQGDGVPFLSPEIVLLYKSNYLNSSDARDHNHDFKVTLPLLNSEQKQWLKEALKVVHSNNHNWLLNL